MENKYSIIVPTYNERLNIALIVYLIFKHLLNVDFEIIVVDNGSPDGTQDIVKQLQSVYGEDLILLRARPKKLGLVTAYIHGLKHASGSFIVIMEADLSHHPKYLPNFIKKQMETGADIVTGTRYVKGGGVHGWNLMRKFEAKPPGFSVRRRRFSQFRGGERAMKVSRITCFLLLTILFAADSSRGIRFSGRMSEIPTTKGTANQHLQMAVFALGSFWRSEVVFGCLDGIVRTTVGYAGGSKPNPEYRSLGDHAESVQIEYDPRTINFKQLLEVFWTSHDSRQVFGQGPDVGNQYRSIIFTNGTEESRTAALSKEREQTKSKSGIVTTQILQLETFYPAESDHQKFELKRNPFLLQLIGNLPEEDLPRSTLAAKLNSYAAELCPTRMQKHIDAKITDIVNNGWPVLREV